MMVDKITAKNNEVMHLQSLLLKYLLYWKYILFSVVLALLGAFLFIKSSVPIYEAHSTVLLKDDMKGGVSDELSILHGWGIGGGTDNVDNEIEILSSWSLSKGVVASLKLYNQHFYEHFFRDEPVYTAIPYRAELTTAAFDSLSAPLILRMSREDGTQLQLTLTYKKQETVYALSTFPAKLTTCAGTIHITKDLSIILPPGEVLRTEITPLTMATNRFRSLLQVNLLSKTTSIVHLQMRDPLLERASIYLNQLVLLYNKQALDDKNRAALNIEHFIDARLSILNKELDAVRTDIEQCKKKWSSGDLSLAASMSLESKSTYLKQYVYYSTQYTLVDFLEQYMKNDTAVYHLLPSNMGVDDPVLLALAAKYNTAVLAYRKLLKASSKVNPSVDRMEYSLALLHCEILSSIDMFKKTLTIRLKEADKQVKKYANRVLDVSEQERELTQIRRWEKVKTSLFTILSRKREENSLTLAANTQKARVVDAAFLSGRPVYPSRRLVCLVGLLVGLLVPIAIIELLEMLSIYIRDKEEIKELTEVPIVGELPFLADLKRGQAVFEGANNRVDEAFRTLRSNMKFVGTETKQQTLLVTSSMPGEGKTFVSINMAISLALLDKKVVLVGLDLRKPRLGQQLGLNHRKGVSNYLQGSISSIDDLIQPSGIRANLSVITSGSIPFNPAELLQNSRLDELIALLRRDFDYIVFDTAPVGLVSDSILLKRLTDMSIYVTRTNVTLKKHLDWLNDIAIHQKLPNMSIVLNGVPIHKLSKSYGYGRYLSESSEKS
ncbi:MAG: polysaccharide biosynthesis tyrosine autokinase [Bacteroidaceae bacterium]|nr:polysaccharide biosynthesis tyrosine autokinase [Bacteroidaceae bacterium]